MKITTPDEMMTGASELESAIIKFDNVLRTNSKDLSKYYLIIIGKFDKTVRKEIENIYLKAGWKNVKCRDITWRMGAEFTVLHLER